MWLWTFFSTTPSTNFVKGIIIMPTEHKITLSQCPFSRQKLSLARQRLKIMVGQIVRSNFPITSDY